MTTSKNFYGVNAGDICRWRGKDCKIFSSPQHFDFDSVEYDFREYFMILQENQKFLILEIIEQKFLLKILVFGDKTMGWLRYKYVYMDPNTSEKILNCSF